MVACTSVSAPSALDQLDQFESTRGPPHARIDLGPRRAADLEVIGHILEHREVRVKGVVLEHHRDVAVLGLDRRDVTWADEHLPLGL
jgi:hypothetical protein